MKMKLMRIEVLTAMLSAVVLMASCSSPSSSGASSSATGSSSSPKHSADDSPLAVAKVQRVVDKALDWTRKGGSATVLGVQELPQENAARADITFNGFQYATDYYGQPISAEKKVKPVPNDRLPTPDELFGQPKVAGFSGKGEATLKHYTDGRWVLTAVHFDLVGVSADMEIR